MVAYVVIPGIDGSDDKHWQSLWERRWGASAVRIAPGSWTMPDLTDWVDAVQTAYEAASHQNGEVALVAHSLGCWAAASWLHKAQPDRITAFLVAPPDPRGERFPRDAAGSFRGLAPRPLPGRSLVVAGDDDPYCDPTTSATFAAGWRAPLHLLADHGHINSESGLGDWPQGQRLLDTLLHP